MIARRRVVRRLGRGARACGSAAAPPALDVGLAPPHPKVLEQDQQHRHVVTPAAPHSSLTGEPALEPEARRARLQRSPKAGAAGVLRTAGVAEGAAHLGSEAEAAQWEGRLAAAAGSWAGQAAGLSADRVGRTDLLRRHPTAQQRPHKVHRLRAARGLGTGHARARAALRAAAGRGARRCLLIGHDVPDSVARQNQKLIPVRQRAGPHLRGRTGRPFVRRAYPEAPPGRLAARPPCDAPLAAK